jgi:Transposase DDE domain
VIARQQGRGLADLATEAGAALIGGASLKAALDLDWDDPSARDQALVQVLEALTAFEGWLDRQPEVVVAQPEVLTSLATAETVRDQDVTCTTAGTPSLRDGVGADRRISVEDSQMRHGRKSRSQLIDGEGRHVLRDLDSGLVAAVGITPANVPEAQVADSISLDLHVQGLTLWEIHIDRAYLSSNLVRERDDDLEISCRAWSVRQSPHFAKTAFELDWEAQTIRCPNAVVLPFEPGGIVHFPPATCASCPLRERCTTSAHGRTVTIHPDERLLQELRERQLTAQGRASCANGWPWSTVWHTSATGKGTAPAIWASARTCWTCDGRQWSIIFTSSRGRPVGRRRRKNSLPAF